MSWEFSIDRGGTFTDCIGVAPDGALHTAKVRWADAAPVEGIRRILERAGAVAADGSLPPCRVKLGTTVATNALLERRGVPTALVANRGLADVFEIGTQERPELFSLRVEKPAPLQQVAHRVAPDAPVGQVVERIRELNQLDSVALDAGQTLIAPVG